MNRCNKNRELLDEFLSNNRTVFDEFKISICRKRIEENFKRLKGVNESLALNMILTLLSRPHESSLFAKLLMNQVDGIFEILEEIKHDPELAFQIARGIGVSR